MSFLYIIYALINLLALARIVKFLYSKALDNYSYFYIHMANITNMMLLVFYFNIIGDMSMKKYVFFVVVALAGIYSVASMYRTLMVPTIKKGTILADEEKLTLPVLNNRRYRAVIVFFISSILSAFELWLF